MAGIVQPMKDIMSRMSTMPVVNQTGDNVSLYVRVWNDQFKKLKEGHIEYLPLPAALLEVISPSDYAEIGQGYSESDIVFRIHLGHENYDNGNGTFEQDLIIFGLRDQLIGILNHYKPTGCGNLFKTSEEASYDHDNVYEYIIDFKASFIDDTGSPQRPDSGKFIMKNPPTEIEIVVGDVSEAGNHQLVQQEFLINR